MSSMLKLEGMSGAAFGGEECALGREVPTKLRLYSDRYLDVGTICVEYKASPRAQEGPTYSDMPSQQKFAGLNAICRMTCTNFRSAGHLILAFRPFIPQVPSSIFLVERLEPNHQQSACNQFSNGGDAGRRWCARDASLATSHGAEPLSSSPG